MKEPEERRKLAKRAEAPKKPYCRPTIESGQAFERRALACQKVECTVDDILEGNDS